MREGENSLSKELHHSHYRQPRLVSILLVALLASSSLLLLSLYPGLEGPPSAWSVPYCNQRHTLCQIGRYPETSPRVLWNVSIDGLEPNLTVTDTFMVSSDLDKDGYLEVLIPVNTVTIPWVDRGGVLCLDRRGFFKWLYLNNGNYPIPQFTYLVDVFGDSNPEVVVFYRDQAEQICLDGSGKEISHLRMVGEDGKCVFHPYLVFSDIDQDGHLEGMSVYDGVFYVHDYDDENYLQAHRIECLKELSVSSEFGPLLSTADIDSDGTCEVIAILFNKTRLWSDEPYTNYLCCIEPPDRVEWLCELPYEDLVRRLAITDLDRDGYYEILVLFFEGQLLCYDASGCLLWTRTNNSYTQIAVAELSNCSFIIATAGNNVQCLGPDGKLIWCKALPGLFGHHLNVAVSPDNDIFQVLVKCYRYVYKYRNEKYTGDLYQHICCLNASGELLWNLSLITRDVFGHPDAPISTFISIDLDNDGVLEIVYPYHHHIICLGRPKQRVALTAATLLTILALCGTLALVNRKEFYTHFVNYRVE